MSTPPPQSERLVIYVGPDVHGYPRTRNAAPSLHTGNDHDWLDDRSADFYRNRLCLIAAGCGCFFGTAALLIAFN
jgi:hypothetical protein